MKTVDMIRLLSPEWGVTDDGMMTTQFGASVAFVTTHVHVVRLSFAKNYYLRDHATPCEPRPSLWVWSLAKFGP